jgi:hypothetical protein
MATKKAPAKKAAAKTKTALSKQAQDVLKLVEIAAYLTDDERRIKSEAIHNGADPEQVCPYLASYDIKPTKAPQFVPPEGNNDERLYDQKKDAWKKFKVDEFFLYEILDALTFVMAQGKLNSRTWVYEVFRTEKNWSGFLEELGVYEQIHRIRDPWWWTLAKLAEHEDFEEGFSTAEDMAEALEQYAIETGQFAELK